MTGRLAGQSLNNIESSITKEYKYDQDQEFQSWSVVVRKPAKALGANWPKPVEPGASRPTRTTQDMPRLPEKSVQEMN